MTKKIEYVLLLVALGSSAAHAVSVSPGSTVVLPGTSEAMEPYLAGNVVQDDLVPFTISSASGSITGDVQERVVLNADGFYDFYWRVLVNPTSTGSVNSLRLGDFGPPTANYNVNYRTDGVGSTAPTSITRFTAGFSSDYNFNLTSGVAPGTSSNFFFMDTTATSYAQNALLDLTELGADVSSGVLEAYGPATPVPLPGAIWLLGSAVAGLGIFRRRSV